MNLNQYLMNEKVFPSLTEIIIAMADAGKKIAFNVRQGALANILGAVDSINVQGETQKKLDVLSNDWVKEALAQCAGVKALASEEEDGVVAVHTNGKYIIAFDPLDGSSNIDINGQIGTIFGIYPAREQVDLQEQFFQAGQQQVCAGYVLYGPATLLVLTIGKGTHCFTLDTNTNEFILIQSQMKIPTDTQEFSINMSNQIYWSFAMQAYIEELIEGKTGVREKYFNMRWNGAMVGDVHRVLSRGGIFLYPSDSKNPKQPAKLRLLYEANPIAFLIEQAGGLAVSEQESILNIQPKELHERVSVILGSATEVEYCFEKVRKMNKL